jgi:hypothetical protein
MSRGALERFPALAGKIIQINSTFPSGQFAPLKAPCSSAVKSIKPAGLAKVAANLFLGSLLEGIHNWFVVSALRTGAVAPNLLKQTMQHPN